MGCLKPNIVWWPPHGKKPSFTKLPPSPLWRQGEFSCGQCITCRLRSSQQWAVRAMHENRMHDLSCFLTLTYADGFLPPRGTLVRDEVPLFNKRLRKFIGGVVPISFLYCGEYGERRGRPHYHQLLFGYRPPDLRFYSQERSSTLWSSEILDKIWGKGNVIVGNIDFDSAAYVARYSLKKQKNSDKILYYLSCPVTGEVFPVRYFDRPFSDIKSRQLFVNLPVFAQASLAPALGLRFLERYSDEVFDSWSSVFKGYEVTLPRYYRKYLESRDPVRYKALMERLKNEDLYSVSTPDMLFAREAKIASKFKTLSRRLEL